MSIEERRPCKVRIERAHNRFSKEGTVTVPDKIEEGAFHRWFVHYYNDEGFQQSQLYAVVELKSGKVLKVESEDLEFFEHPLNPRK
ncbi:MAG: hypothetical protein IPM49_12250 [Flavobacteriales bacterium]|nr:hypothetical protein [Flavobacteriales bacterium]